VGNIGGKHTSFNLIGVFLLVGLSTRAFTVEQTTYKAASRKVVKHQENVLTINMHLHH